jgi:hypothetical protein
MLDVAQQMFSQGKDTLELTALHLTVGSEINPLRTDNFERISFGPILHEAKKLNMQIHPRYEVSNNAGQSIVDIVNSECYDFLLVGAGISMSNLTNDVAAQHIHESFFGFFKRIHAQNLLFSPSSLLQDKTKLFIDQSHCSVGIFVNRGFVKATHVILIINEADDLFLLDYAKVLLKATQGTASVLNRTSFVSSMNELILKRIAEFIASMDDAIVLPEKELMRESFSGHDFMLISYQAWNILSEECEEDLKDMPSTLIINHHKTNTTPI